MNLSITILFALIVVLLIILYKLELILVYILTRKINFSKLTGRSIFSSDVMDVFLLAIEHPEYFSVQPYIIKIKGKQFSIWTANTLDARRFYTNNEYYQETVKGMNSKLTYYDKYLLDKLCSSVKEGQTKTLERLFDKKLIF